MMKLTLLISWLAAASAFASLSVGNNRCEYRTNPVGVDTPAPRLSWVLESKERGTLQSAYQVLVASSSELLKRGQGDLWDSGRVESDQSTQVAYGGQPLASGQTCFWKVRVWNRAGATSDWSQPATWTMGLLQPADWQATWIGFADWNFVKIFFLHLRKFIIRFCIIDTFPLTMAASLKYL